MSFLFGFNCCIVHAFPFCWPQVQQRNFFDLIDGVGAAGKFGIQSQRRGRCV